MHDPAFVVLGASGWVGHYLVPELAARNPGAEVIAVYGKRAPAFPAGPGIRLVQAEGDFAALLSLLPPATLVHLGRGEEEKDFGEHRRLIEVTNKKGGRYLYASSFNAVDGVLDRAHEEGDPPGSRTDYGRFKARCEEELARVCERWAAFRFAATHGWAPNREARTQGFLRQLQAGQPVKVHKGVRQNRSFVGDLAAQIAMLAGEPGADGVFHLGTRDASEELHFLRRLALAFGYPEELVVEDGVSECNAEMVVGKLRALFPNYELPSESDTLAKVAAQPELKVFHR